MGLAGHRSFYLLTHDALNAFSQLFESFALLDQLQDCFQQRIGAAQYNTYQNEDGKCFVLDLWVFPQFRGNGTGHRCFEALERYTKLDGAVYYELNSTKENAIRFWKSLGFVENGVDEYEMPVMVRKEHTHDQTG